MNEAERKYWIAFRRVPSIGRARYELLLRYFGSLQAAWNAPAGELRRSGLDSRATSGLTAVRAKLDVDGEVERMKRVGVRAYTWQDDNYPPRLKEIYDPPPVLFVKGELLRQDERSIAVVGTRRATAYGREATALLTGDLARRHVTIVSGLARGIDAIAHKQALDTDGRTIAVLGHGLDRVYPPEHGPLANDIAQRGALVSEYPLGVRPDAQNFPRRNRIMSGMSLGTLVVEAPEGSGTRWTVIHALEQDREVFCVPGSIFSPNSKVTNHLIQQGAKLVMDYRDVLEELNLADITEQLPLPMPAQTLPTDEAETALIQNLGYEPTHIDDIGRLSGLPMATVSSTLALMELKGLVKQVGAMNYVRARGVAAPYQGVS